MKFVTVTAEMKAEVPLLEYCSIGEILPLTKPYQEQILRGTFHPDHLTETQLRSAIVTLGWLGLSTREAVAALVWKDGAHRRTKLFPGGKVAITLPADLRAELRAYYPGKVTDLQRSYQGRTDYDLKEVARTGNLRLLRWLIDQRPTTFRLPTTVILEAARGGQLEMLQWMHSRGWIRESDLSSIVYEIPSLPILEWLADLKLLASHHFEALSAAIADEDMERVEWLLQQGASFEEEHLVEAACAGNLSLYRQVEQALQLSSKAEEQPDFFRMSLVSGAAYGGNVEILESCLASLPSESGPEVIRSAYVQATVGGHLPVLEALLLRAPPEGNVPYGKVETMEWMQRHGCSVPGSLMKAAIQNGDLPAVYWLLEAKCPFEGDLVKWAIQSRSLPMIRTVCGLPGVQLESRHGEIAGKEGHLAIVRYLVGTGRIDPVGTATAASSSGHLEVVSWLLRKERKDQLTANTQKITEAAVAGGQIKVLHWMFAHQYKSWTNDWVLRLFRRAVTFDQVKVLAYLVRLGCDWRAEVWITSTREVQEWIAANGGQWRSLWAWSPFGLFGIEES